MQFKSLTKSMDHMKKRSDISLSIKLDVESIGVVVFSDASIANTRDKRKRYVFVAHMIDAQNCTNIVHNRPRR